MSNIFISYAREDAQFVELLYAKLNLALNAEGVTVFMDLENLDAGDEWGDKIDQAIRNSAAVIVVLTPSAARSHFVTYEWALARGAGVRVIPLEVEKGDWHVRLSALQVLDFSRRPHPWEQLYEEVRKAVQRAAAPVTRSPNGASSATANAIAALDSAKEEEQIEGVRSLATIDEPAASDALQVALRHASSRVRAVAALHTIARDAHRGNADVAAGLLELRVDDITQWREVTLLWPHLKRWSYLDPVTPIDEWALQIGPVAIPPLLAALDQPHLRYMTLRMLSNLADARAVPKLVEVASSETEEELKDLAVDGLVVAGDLAVLPLLLKSLDDSREWRRCKAVQDLAAIGGAATVSRLLQTLREDPQRSVRAAAVAALAKLGREHALGPLLEVLADPTEAQEVRVAAVNALGALRATAAAPQLQKLLESALAQDADSYDWRYATMAALLRLHDSEPLVERGIRRMESPNSGYLGSALTALGEQGSSALPMMRALLDPGAWHKERIRLHVGKELVVLLSKIGSPEALDVARAWKRKNMDR